MVETTQPTAAPALVDSPSGARQIGHFVLHYFEMCMPMCVGFAVLDLVYFGAAGLVGYPHPFSELPELSVLVVGFNMTLPMAVWMRFRHMPARLPRCQGR